MPLASSRSCSARDGLAATGATEKPHSPTTSVVTPWLSELVARGNVGSVWSACECRSMKPGATARPPASQDVSGHSLSRVRANRDDPPVANRHVALDARPARAVEEHSAANQQVHQISCAIAR